MCRLLGYLGSTIQLDKLLYQPEHSLIVQSHQPQEMTAGLVNVDGFGVGWYHPQKSTNPYTYKNILPIGSDINLPQLSRYIESNCVLAYVRSATPPLAVDLTNCQPFTNKGISFIHNGFINKFRETLYRPLRNCLDDYSYQLIHGTTDSEHIFALIVNELNLSPQLSLAEVLKNALTKLTALATTYHVYFSANVILSNGQELVASRYANRYPTPTLYFLKDHSVYPQGVIIASEPLFQAEWSVVPESNILTVGQDLTVNLISLSSELCQV